MNNLELNVQAGTRYVSNEMQEFLERAVFLIPNWKWFALAAGFVALYFLRIFLVAVIKRVRRSHTSFLKETFLHFFFELEIEKTLSWVVVSIVGMMLLTALDLPLNLAEYLRTFFKLILAFNLIMLCYLAVEGLGLRIQHWAKKTATPLDDQLAPLATKTLKVLVIIVGVLLVLQNFNVNVTALLAGLGIGGVALAFAAQDTVSNVFGTITILLDRPFRMGDRIKIGDTDGVVEEVGFRSTRIRTLYNTVVTLPNSVVAKEKIDNLSERAGWFRFHRTIGFTYDTSVETLRQFCEHLKYLLLQDPKVDRDRISITFNAYGESSLDVLVSFHFHLDNFDEEMLAVQTYLEMIFAITQQLKLNFAFPTRTLILQNANQPIQPVQQVTN
jgi:MscS family membrane protein